MRIKLIDTDLDTLDNAQYCEDLYKYTLEQMNKNLGVYKPVGFISHTDENGKERLEALTVHCERVDAGFADAIGLYLGSMFYNEFDLGYRGKYFEDTDGKKYENLKQAILINAKRLTKQFK